MRCPRCGFDGELIDDGCAHCGYRRVSVNENGPGMLPPGARVLSDTLRGGVSGPLSSPPRSLRDIAGQPRSPSMPLHDVSGRLRPPAMYNSSGPLHPPAMPLRDMSGPLTPQPPAMHSSSGPLYPPAMPLREISSSLHVPSMPSRSLLLSTAKGGDTLKQGRYRLIDQLVLPDNQQAQGAAWLAVDTFAGQTRVVVREVALPLNDPEQRQRIVLQAVQRLSVGTQHGGFPRVLDTFSESGSPFVVIQYLEGESLASLLRRQGGALPERTVAEYGSQLCEMLAALAQQPKPIIHGAISPETVIVSPDRNRVHLIHFPLFPPKETLSAGALQGYYKAPEQAHEPANTASDLYAVAATMYHAVTGSHPRERIAFYYPPARQLNPLVSERMEAVLARELHSSALQRYARAADLQADLLRLLAAKIPESEKRPSVTGSASQEEGMVAQRRRKRRRSRTQLSIFVCLSLLILGGLLFASFSSFFKQGANPTPQGSDGGATATASTLQNALNNEWLAEAPLYRSKGIGISDGRYVFDAYNGRSAAEIGEKQDAAQALLANNLSLALHDYGLAVASDKTDAEARIYYEDLQIEEQETPFVTFVLGLPLDGIATDLTLSRADMQAAFAVQYQANHQNFAVLPGGFKLRLLIANSGSDTFGGSSTDDGDVATVAQFINRRVELGNPGHILAVIGWPKSQESEHAITMLAAAQIPLVSPAAVAPALSGISSYFFHLSPTPAAQGLAQAQFAYQTLNARRVLVMSDPGDPYSQAQASAFVQHFQQLGGTIVDNLSGEASSSFTEGQTTVEQFKTQIAQSVLVRQADLIYLPGLDVDAVRLAHALGEESRAYPWSTYLAHLPILGDDGFDSGLLLGQGSGSDAQLAQKYPQDMRRLLFTAFASVGAGGSQLQSMLTNWKQLYATSANGSSAPVPTSDAIMVNDAFGVVIDALGQVSGIPSGESVRAALAGIGTGSVEPYQGASGRLAFDNRGNPLNKTLVLLEVAANSATGQNEIKFMATS